MEVDALVYLQEVIITGNFEDSFGYVKNCAMFLRMCYKKETRNSI
jgi:hypothetical protein